MTVPNDADLDRIERWLRKTSGSDHVEAADIIAELREQLRKATDYKLHNPWGGPAIALVSCAQRIMAGEEYYSALSDFGLTTIEKAEADNATLKQDAERYRTWRSMCIQRSMGARDTAWKHLIAAMHVATDDAEGFDAAIDAAMLAGKEGE